MISRGNDQTEETVKKDESFLSPKVKKETFVVQVFSPFFLLNDRWWLKMEFAQTPEEEGNRDRISKKSIYTISNITSFITNGIGLKRHAHKIVLICRKFHGFIQ